MDTSLNLQKASHQQMTPEINKQVYFKSSDSGSDTVTFKSNKPSTERIITIASIGTAIAASIACVRSRMQMNKIEQKMVGYFKDMGENLIPEGKNIFNRISGCIDKFFCLSAKDTLTGLYNRRYLYANLPKIMERAKSKGENITIAMIDLDYFKSINTAFDHEGGDEFLRQIAKNLKKVFNEEDELVARYGGEEITIITKNPEKLKKLAQEIRTNPELLSKKDEYLKIFRDLEFQTTNLSDKTQYNNYINHVTKNNGFTTSIGYLNVNNSNCLNLKPEEFIELADKPLESLKKSCQRGEIKEVGKQEIIDFCTEKIKVLTIQNNKSRNPEIEADIARLQKKLDQLKAN